MALKALRNDVAAMVAVVCVAAGAALFALHFISLARTLENGLRDLVHILAYPKAGLSDDVVIVAITEETLEALSYRSPIDRDFLSNLIEAISAHDPASIGVDILFDSATEAAKDDQLERVLNAPRPHPLIAAYPDANTPLTGRQRTFLDAMLPPDRRGLAILLADPDDGVVREIMGSEGDVRSFAFSQLGSEAPDRPVGIAFQFMVNPNDALFPIYPAHTAAFLPAEWFANKHVLIGAILPQTDQYATPRSSLFGAADTEPGVLIHAQVLQQVIDGRSLITLSAASVAVLTIIAAFIAYALMIAPVNVVFRFSGVAVFCLVWGIGAGLLLRNANVVMPIFTPLFASVLAAGVKGGAQWRSEALQKAFIRSTFSRYVSPAIVNELIDTPALLHKRPVRREATCIFTDVAGFTTMTERYKATPETIEILLNEYLSGMASIFRNHGATIDKFIGDAVVGFFGGPLPRSDHAQAAIEMAADLDRFAEDFARTKTGSVSGFGHTRIGVHSGEVLIGNFGGDVFFDYTAIGDAVNTAARLEAANKHFGTRVCASDVTLAQADNPPASRPIGRIILKGKTEPLLVHEILSHPHDTTILEEYLAAYSLLDNDPSAAEDRFLRYCEVQHGDALAKFHLERLLRGERGALIEMESK